MELQMNEKVAPITGTNHGIDSTVALVPAREGMQVCLVIRDQSKLHEIAANLTNSTREQVQIRAEDLHTPVAPARTVADAATRFGRHDWAVNNAGATKCTRSAKFPIRGSVNVAFLDFTKKMADIGANDGLRIKAIDADGQIETDRFTRNVERGVLHRGTLLLRSRGTMRTGHPYEIGHFVAYLASPRTDFVQGAIVDVDGGANRAR